MFSTPPGSARAVAAVERREAEVPELVEDDLTVRIVRLGSASSSPCLDCAFVRRYSACRSVSCWPTPRWSRSPAGGPGAVRRRVAPLAWALTSFNLALAVSAVPAAFLATAPHARLRRRGCGFRGRVARLRLRVVRRCAGRWAHGSGRRGSRRRLRCARSARKRDGGRRSCRTHVGTRRSARRLARARRGWDSHAGARLGVDLRSPGAARPRRAARPRQNPDRVGARFHRAAALRRERRLAPHFGRARGCALPAGDPAHQRLADRAAGGRADRDSHATRGDRGSALCRKGPCRSGPELPRARS